MSPVPHPVLPSALDTASAQYRASRAHMSTLLDEIAAEQAAALAGGGEKYTARHRERGKLPVRERIDLLLDEHSPFLELSPLAGWGTADPVGSGFVTGIGTVSGVQCVILANDPTVRGGSRNPSSMLRMLRALDIAESNRLPVVNLTESGGADLDRQAEIFVPGGEQFARLTRMSAAGIPSVTVVFGPSTAGGAYVPGMSDYTILVEDRARVYLGGPPLVKMATGEEADEEELGGAAMHARLSGLADFLAADETDALATARRVVGQLGVRRMGPTPLPSPEPPKHNAEELLGVVPADLRTPMDVREVIARITDGSGFTEFKPEYGPKLVTGWARLHGYPVGVIGNNGVLFSEEAQKGAQFIHACNRSDTPLLFLQNITGFMVGTRYEQGGIIKDGAALINAVTNSAVPHLTLMVGASYGAGNYAMSGRAFRPRFLFTWPNHRIAVMGPKQLSGVLSIVRRNASAAGGRPFDEAADAERRAALEAKVERESSALYATGHVWDDGVIDPRHTRDVLGIALSATHAAEVRGTTAYGAHRH
ncbi:acyl-CoA carboxylase subunit beta [Streptomyces sp. NPDC056728]